MTHHDNDNVAVVSNGLRFLSVCSGIEAASVAWPTWQAVAFSEIEKFPSAVLAHHYPNVPNLGDMTKFKEWPDLEIDVLCGGTPCQAFSVAGLREGLNDPRGNLTLTFLGIAERYKPEWIVWENVPGILSDKTGALISFLDGLEALGYVVDVDIEDAQFFGLAQRRRRIIVCGQHVKHILNQRTISSALTLAQCLQETSLNTLDVVTTLSTSARQGSNSNESSAFLSLTRRMKLFGLQQGEPASTSVERLAAILASLECAQSDSELEVGSSSVVDIRKVYKATPQPTSSEVTAACHGASASIEMSWQTILADPLQTMKECITSTSSKGTIDSKIYSCAKLTLSIARRIHQSMDSSPVFWSAAQSSLTALKGFTSYARQTSSDLFGDMAWVRAWGDFIEQAEPTIKSLENLRVESFDEVLPLSAGMSRNPPPRREAGKDAAPTISARPTGGGGLGADFDLDGGLVEAAVPHAHAGYKNGLPALGAQGGDVGGGSEALVYAPEIARCDATREGSSQDYESTTMVAHAIQGNMIGGDKGGPLGAGHQEELSYTLTKADVHAVCVTGTVTHTLKAEGADASEDGTGRGTPIIAFTAKDYGGDAAVDIAPTLRAGTHDGSHANGGVSPAIAYGICRDALDRSGEGANGTAGERSGLGITEELSPTLKAKGANAVAQTVALRGREGGATAELGGGDATALRASSGGGDKPHVLTDVHPIVLEDQGGSVINWRQDGTVGTLRRETHGHEPAIATHSAVRRLTPTECERLQGFPDGYTDIPWRGKPNSPDGPRYKALGNSWAVPKFRWLGERIQRLMPAAYRGAANDNTLPLQEAA